MDISALKNTAQEMVAPKKGILAADESSKTIQERFDKIGLASTPETDLAYRKMLFATEGIEEFLSGVILYDETIRQEIDGLTVPQFLAQKGIIPGIKVDKGTVELSNSANEKVTEGLEGLDDRLKEYKAMGARFAKWRAVITIGDGVPTDKCILENADRLAKYAKICQDVDIVPIVEPEVLMDWSNSIEMCGDVTRSTLKAVFEKLAAHGVMLEGMILKSNMTISGKLCPVQVDSKHIAKATIDTFSEVVPSDMPGIVFLSGGQSPDQATENLNEINLISGSPWQLSYSYGRALQDEALRAWVGKEENIEVAQKAFYERSKKVSLARQGKLN